MVQKASLTLRIIDEAIDKQAEDKHRHHLGGSIIGHPCSAHLWYTFRWAKKEKFPARIRRLFDRGHKEEERIEKWLTDAGIKVYSFDDKGDQFKVSEHFGHFGGSLDGRLLGVPDVPEGKKCLGEYKTHNDKSFKKLEQKGVQASKYQHYVQMNVYMYLDNLRYALYVAVNKNDDAIYTEIIELDVNTAELMLARAKRIIFAQYRPARVANDPTWWQCKFCTYKDICHYGDEPEVNCRTCNHATPVEDKKWLCGKYMKYIPKDFLQEGCQQHEFLPDMIKKEE